MISIDFETYSDVDLTEVGVYVYAMHPSTEVLICCYSLDEGKTVHEWVKGEAPPRKLIAAVKLGLQMRAFNSEFEELIWQYVCTRMGWPEVPTDQWLDTQSLTYSLALPGSLEECASALQLKIRKNKEGKRLIRKFCMPRKPTKANPSTRILPEDSLEDFKKFVVYCADDVRVECAIYDEIPRKQFDEFEAKVVAQNKLMNRRGVCLDVDAFKAISKMIDTYRHRETERLIKITQGAVRTDGQRAAIISWAKSRGYELKGFTKDAIVDALEDPDLDPLVRQVLEIRQALGQVSTKKYEKMNHVCCPDGRARGNLTYHRASTGRNGGSGLQLHNFPRDYVSKSPRVIEQCIDFIGREMYDVVEALYGKTLDVAKGLLRPMVRAPKGQVMYVADFSGVENRGTGWVARDPVALKVFQDKRDQYREFAATQFRITAEQVTDEQRTGAKATILGCIFGSGWKTIYETNLLRGIPMTESEAQRNVEDFRNIYAVTVATWYDLERSSRTAVQKRIDVEYKQLKFGVRGDFLFIRLASGRLLAYYKPRVEPVMTPWGKEKVSVTYMGLTPQRQWIRMTLTLNRLIENVVSATCRDLLMHCRLLIEQDGRVTPVLDVHDEIVSYGDEDAMTLDEYVAFMERTPEWATNDQGVTFPLAAEGYKSVRYKK